MKHADLTHPIEPLDDFDPRTWCEPVDTSCYIHLSDRIDIYVKRDAIERAL